MDLSGPAPAPDFAAHVRIEAQDAQALVAQLGSEVAATLSGALEQVSALEATGTADGTALTRLREAITAARRAGIHAQQLVRLGNGSLQLNLEALDLTTLLREALDQRGREIHARGIEVQQALAPARVRSDTTLLFSLLQTALDWALEHTASRIELTLTVTDWPPCARLGLAYSHLVHTPIGGAAGRPLPAEETALNTMSWHLLRQTAAALGLRMWRHDPPGRTRLVFEFTDTLAPHAGPAGTTPFDGRAAPALPAQPLAGRHVLVLAGRRDVRNAVREALRPMGPMLDFVASLEEVQQQCADTLPHAVVYEASLGGPRFDRLRAELLAQAPRLAFVEIAEQGKAMQVIRVGGHALTSVGRDAIIESLPEALVFELMRG